MSRKHSSWGAARQRLVPDQKFLTIWEEALQQEQASDYIG